MRCAACLSWSLIAGCALLTSCGQDPEVVRAMYHWRNDDAITDDARTFLDTHAVGTLFHKVLDIDWNEANHAYPTSINAMPDLVQYTYGLDSGRIARLGRMQRVPVVFLTERTMRQCDTEQLTTLADKLVRKLDQLCPQGYDELQLDCDWSAHSSAHFFTLVRWMKERTGRPVSVTIRLHQYRHPELTGVPPADRGMLMLYNVEDVKRAEGRNSIFNAEAAAPYFSGARPYPIPLDIALPAFSWVLHFRQDRFMGIREPSDMDDLVEQGVCHNDSAGWYSVVKEDEDHWWSDGLHVGDRLHWERTDSTALMEAVRLARTAANDDTVRVSFFDLQAYDRPVYDHATFEQAWDAFP